MTFKLRFTPEAKSILVGLKTPSGAAKLKKVNKALGFLQTDPFYPSLQSHKYSSLKGTKGEEVFDSYVENHTPAAWRIFWHYGPQADELTILTITPHP
ncbi:hypothetical protein C3B59_18235 [Cryobacterium zongtaii]|uniref:Type II toxin-antitoxin system RelE/ParE family toxin n=1 Tax=Cryobacterium zongtaii TaxID=1259217 RepID=A0A2S3Z5J5_9MICO|nr:hypothetical protein [Cryobacterium zongtaii]POH59153.1 hypothetical protein C3B59_18235 [Cryobacterium zongtaii]